MIDMKTTIVKSKKSVSAVMSGFGLALMISGCASTYKPISAHEPIGVLGLYKSESPETVRFDERKIASLGCALKREGLIGGVQGNIGIDQPNRFVLLTCNGSLLTDIDKHAMFNALAGNVTANVVLEGPIVDLPNSIGDGKIEDREYILKISHYNNKDIDGRSKSLANIDRHTSALSDKYVTESFIGVTHASGMPTPDEVVVIYYDSPEQGERFRANNSEVLGLIGEFNSEHVNKFVYLVGKAIR